MSRGEIQKLNGLIFAFVLLIILFGYSGVTRGESKPELSQETLTVCKNLAEEAKAVALAEIHITKGPFKTIFNETIPMGCSFGTPSKPKASDKLIAFFKRNKWKDVARYFTGSGIGSSWGASNSQTICIVQEFSDADGDDTDLNEEILKHRKRKPWMLYLDCTDITVFNSVPHL